MSDICKRKLSVYDNVDLNESFEAAKRLASEEQVNSLPAEGGEPYRYDIYTDDANSEQFNDDQQVSLKDAIASNQQTDQPGTASGQSNGQLKYTHNGATNGNHHNTQATGNGYDGYAETDQSTGHQLERQNKKTSSFKEKFLRRKSSIPTLKRNDSQRKNRPSAEIVKPLEVKLIESIGTHRSPEFEPANYRADRLSDCSLDGPSDRIDHRSPRQSKSLSSYNKTSTPIGKSSQIPRLNSSMGQKQVLNSESPSQPAACKLKATAPSNIPTNSTTIKTNLSTSNCDEAPRSIKIYVPFAEISSRNNSKTNSLASSTNSINGANGLRSKKDDQNKITINVNQKYETSIGGKANLKSYLPTIDT